MADIIPPRRGESLTNSPGTKRFMEYLEAITESTNSSASIASSVSDTSALRAQLKALQQQVGSGNPLTWDETGFTWDSTRHSFDETEA